MSRDRLAILAIPVVCLSAVIVQGQTAMPAAVRAAAARITATQLAGDLAFLASDELRGRDTASPGFDKAAAHITSRLAKAGVRPFGDRGGWYQYYDLRDSNVDAAEAVVEIGGARFPLGDGFVMRSLAEPVSGTYRAVYVGHGWTVPGRNIDPFAGLDVRGAMVVAHGPRALPRGVEIPQLGRMTPGATPVIMEAYRRGAAGVIILPVASALADWAQAREQNLRVRELVPPVPSAYAATPITAVMLSAAGVDALFANERVSGADIRRLGEAQDYPESFTLTKTVRVHVPARTTMARPYNVVALIEGSDPVLREEYITIEAHMDGAVGTRAVDGDAIYNSADDNATGTAGILAIAEQMVALKPKRSLIFIWDSGEERGLWGTRQFVHAPPVPLDRIVLHFNVDMIGATRAPGLPDADSPDVTGPNEVYVVGPGVLSHQADAVLERVNREYLGLTLNRRFDTPASEFFYPRSDAGPFLERGILPIGFFTGLHPRYHLPADEAKYLDPAKMEAVTRTVFAAVWAFADAPERPRIDRPMPPTVPQFGRGGGRPD